MSEMQQEAMAVLSEIWQLSPEVRLGQLMAHLDFLSETYLCKGLGYVDDDELLAILYHHRSELNSRMKAPPKDSPMSPESFASISGHPMLARTTTPADNAH